jgi:periplasmic protein TonB
VVGLLERNKRYPEAAQARNQHGTVELAFSLDRQGRVTASRIAKSSGSSALDEATLDLVRRAQPFPAPPPEMAGAEVNLSVPIRYNIR